jgi:peptide methionine sulfoxide reductase MsrB
MKSTMKTHARSFHNISIFITKAIIISLATANNNPNHPSNLITLMGQNIAKLIMSGVNNKQPYPAPAVMGEESIMKQKAHGTSDTPVQQNLRWNVDRDVADRICNFNRHYAEHAGYFKTVADFMNETNDTPASSEITFYDSNTGKPLFYAPRGRTMEEFVRESRNHGWPSFRDNEVEWKNVRLLKNGETVSVDGTHLGHNLPDGKGSRYCINLVCVAGRPTM